MVVPIALAEPTPIGEAVVALVNVGFLIYNATQTLEISRYKPGMKGGSQKQRDRDFGIKNRDFWNWWHKDPNGKKAWGTDLNEKILNEVLEDWKNLGYPKGPK